MYQSKFLVCENLLGNKPASDSDFDLITTRVRPLRKGSSRLASGRRNEREAYRHQSRMHLTISLH